MISFIYKIKTKTVIDEDDRYVEEGNRRVKRIKGVNCIMMDGNQTFNDEHTVVCADVGL